MRRALDKAPGKFKTGLHGRSPDAAKRRGGAGHFLQSPDLIVVAANSSATATYPQGCPLRLKLQPLADPFEYP